MRRVIIPVVLTAALAVSAASLVSRSAAEPATAVPPPVHDTADSTVPSEVAVLAGGCFWGVQGVFQHVDGVISAISGYAGGAKDTAHYDMVGSGATGHAESVRITFDPQRISYGRILQIYFSVAHNPTELNYQGPDRGPQYRSTIFPINQEQADIARSYIAQLDAEHAFHAPIVTTIEPGKAFYPAEAYHQDYLTRHPDSPYIVYNDLPKVKQLQQQFPDRYRMAPVLVAAKGAPP